MKHTVKCLFLLSVFWFGSNQRAFAQAPLSEWNLGVEFQAYPAGIIPGITGEYQWSETSSLVFRLGANLADRQDFSGLNDDERGRGPGATIGYRYQFRSTGWYLGGRTDFWWMKINWEDADEVPASGTTTIGVLQPTLEAGYCWDKERWKFGVGTAQGFEINVISRGEDVGQGFISLIQLFAVRKLGES